MGTDWAAWHAAYSRPGSGLDDRLAAVQASIARYLDGTGDRPVRVISACAGDARDLVGVLASHDGDARRVTGFLVEYDPGLAGRAREATKTVDAGLAVRCADAADSSIYVDAVPADLVLMCGVFGNISDQDIATTIAALPQLCAEDGEVIWTRHRAEPDITPKIRDWFRAAGFDEVSFAAPENDTWSVGTHRFIGTPQPLTLDSHWFTFIR